MEGQAELLQKVLDTSAAITATVIKDGLRPHWVVPQGYKVESPTDSLLEKPWRLKQVVKVFDAESFTKYFTDYCNENSRIFVDIQAPTIFGVIDYHVASKEPQAEWGEHRLVYEFRQTPEWKAWSGSDRQPLTQVKFAQFIEDNLPDITRPSGAELLEVSRTLQIKKNVNFSSAVRLNNGEIQFTYEEEIKGMAKKDTIEIPESFDLAIAPFEGLDRYKVEARLRYMLKEDGLQLRYELVRPHKILEDAVKTVVTKIAGGVSNPITYGVI